MTAEGVHTGTEQQTSSSSNGSFLRLADIASPFNLHVIMTPKSPSWGLHGPSITVNVDAKSSSVKASGKGRAANESRAIKGERQLGWGPRGLESGSSPATM